MACLDTTALIDIYRPGRSHRSADAERAITGLAASDQMLVTTRFNVAELYVGAERSGNRQAEYARISELLQDFTVLDFTDDAARVFGQIQAHLMRLGTVIGRMDVLIAATALVGGHCIITSNSRHFERIPALRVIVY